MQKIDISSTAIEKGVDIAKQFVEKLIYPSAEEMGLLLKDSVSKWRFMRQVKTLVKAQSICEKNGVKTQMVSPKLLTPLLEYASLEDNEKLQDKWATLLANMVDSAQNVENLVFPYLLSQVSIQEFELLENTLNQKIERVKKVNEELDDYLKSKNSILSDLEEKIESKKREISNSETEEYAHFRGLKLKDELKRLDNQKQSFLMKQTRLEGQINQAELLTRNDLRNFEISNLIRLGVVREIVNSYGYVDRKRLWVEKDEDYSDYSELYVDLDDLPVTIEPDVIEHELTELGELFIKACQEKK